MDNRPMRVILGAVLLIIIGWRIHVVSFNEGEKRSYAAICEYILNMPENKDVSWTVNQCVKKWQAMKDTS